MSGRICFSKIAEKISIEFTLLGLMVGSAFAAMPQYAKGLGPEDQNKQITVTVWLKQHNKAALDALVKQMYDKTSLNYHHFLTLEQYKDRFAPTAEESSVVRDFLRTHNLSAGGELFRQPGQASVIQRFQTVGLLQFRGVVAAGRQCT